MILLYIYCKLEENTLSLRWVFRSPYSAVLSYWLLKSALISISFSFLGRSTMALPSRGVLCYELSTKLSLHKSNDKVSWKYKLKSQSFIELANQILGFSFCEIPLESIGSVHIANIAVNSVCVILFMLMGMSHLIYVMEFVSFQFTFEFSFLSLANKKRL